MAFSPSSGRSTVNTWPATTLIGDVCVPSNPFGSTQGTRKRPCTLRIRSGSEKYRPVAERSRSHPIRPPAPIAEEIHMADPIRIGIIGCGRILPAHLRGYRLLREGGIDDFRITALVARRPEDAHMF